MDRSDEDPDWEAIWAGEAQARREYRLSNAHTQTLEAIRWEVLPRLRAAYSGHPLVAAVRSELRDREPHVLRVMVVLVERFWRQTRTVAVQFHYRSDAIRTVADLRGLPRLSEAREVADPGFDPVPWAEEVIRRRCRTAMRTLLRSRPHRFAARRLEAAEEVARVE
jgi:hypothetical protein